jgi:hypothetical protein
MAFVWSALDEKGGSPWPSAAPAIMSIAMYPTMDVDPLLDIVSLSVEQYKISECFLCII